MSWTAKEMIHCLLDLGMWRLIPCVKVHRSGVCEREGKKDPRSTLQTHVVDEETDDGSDLPPEFVETNETTADSSGCDLGDVDGLAWQ
jgi:hypothetical protein